MASVGVMTSGSFVDLDKQEARNAVLEEAAKVAEEKTDDGQGNMRFRHPHDIAMAIRALKKT